MTWLISSLYPLAQRSFREVYCFQHVHDFVIPSIFKVLLNNFDSFFQILFKFTPHLNHQTVHVWKENGDWRISITRVMPLCNSYNKMFVLWLIVHTLWNQLVLELSLDLFNTLQICYRHIEDLHKEVWCLKHIFWQIDRVFNLAIFWQLLLVNDGW